MKKKVCYVSLDPEADNNKVNESTELKMVYELPDGQEIGVDSERFMGPEILFDPELVKEDSKLVGIHEMSYQSVQECDIYHRLELYGNIILSGGTSLIAGLSDRLK